MAAPDFSDIPGLLIYCHTEGGTGTPGVWADQSGNGNDLTQAVPPFQPVLTPNQFNGASGYRHEVAANYYWDIPSIPLIPLVSGTAFVLAKRDSDASFDNGGLWKLGNDSNGYVCHHPYSTGTIYDDFGSTVRREIVNYLSTDFSVPRVYAGVSAPNDIRIFWDGATAFASANNAVSWSTTPRLGNGGGGSFTGYIGLFAFWDHALTNDEIWLVHRRIKEWGAPFAHRGALQTLGDGYLGTSTAKNNQPLGQSVVLPEKNPLSVWDGKIVQKGGGDPKGDKGSIAVLDASIGRPNNALPNAPSTVYVMRAVEAGGGCLAPVYRYWTAIGAPDLTGAEYTGPRCTPVGSLTQITVIGRYA